jgi:hypothetical protein
MTTRLFQRISLVATSLLIFGTPTARGACTIADVHPTATLPTPMSNGERFIFEASADCASVEFTSGAFSAIPVPGPRGGSGPRQYHVNVRPSVWNRLVRGSDATFEWTVRGWTTAGVLTEVTTTNELDFDEDGWTRSEGDDRACDYDPARHPRAQEMCDGIDQDCDGRIDEGEVPWFVDIDGDGYGDDSISVDASCDGIIGYVTLSGDCDDADATINPGATEICDDVDDDCDGIACTLSLPDADAVYATEGPDDLAGHSVAGAGDVDGDGYDDMLVGAPYNNDGADRSGKAYLVRGGPSPASISLSAADAVYTGEAAGDFAGVSVAGAGDVDGDGYHDLLVGAEGSGVAGAAYLVLGGPVPASAPLSAADAEYTGEAASDKAGYSVAGAGDVDGDGYCDILVGAFSAGSSFSGSAYLVLGGPSPTSASLSAADAEYTGRPTDAAGGSVAGAGDVDGDGYDDMLVGAFLKSVGLDSVGAAYVVLGDASPASGSLSAADAEYVGESGQAGYSVAGAGDVNADGYADVLVGAKYHGEVPGVLSVGAAYLVLGGPSPASASLSDADAQYTGEIAFDFAGSSVAGAGDVDRDGYSDVLVGAPGHTHDYAGDDYLFGAAYLILGDPSPASVSLSAADAKYTGEARYDYAGPVAGPGDVDGDGYGDVLVGAPGNYLTYNPGAAYLLLGGGF